MPEKPTHLQEFARLIGSPKGTHPIPPAQYLSYQDKRYPPKFRLWSFLLECSIAPGRRHGFATIHDIPVTLGTAAKVLQIDHANTCRAWRELENEHRAFKAGHTREEKGDYLWVSGDFKLPREKRAPAATDAYPAYYQKQIDTMRPDLRDQFLQEDAADQKLRDAVIADAVAAARFTFDQRQNSRFQRYGVKLIREKHRAARGKETEKAERDRRVGLLLPVIEKFVQTIEPPCHVQTSSDSVQTTTPEPETPATRTAPEGNSLAPAVLSSNPEKERVNRGYVGRGERTYLPTPAVKAEELRAMLNRTLAQKLKTTPTSRLTSSIFEKLRNGTIADLEERIKARYDAITSYGMVSALAEDVASAAAVTPPRPAQAQKLCRQCNAAPIQIDGICFECHRKTEAA